MSESWQLRAAEDYIELNWNRPIYVEDIAKATGASARTIFQAFREKRGCSPMEFAKSIRLKQARRLLQTPDEATTVTGVGSICGFQILVILPVVITRCLASCHPQRSHPPKDLKSISRKKEGAHGNRPRDTGVRNVPPFRQIKDDRRDIELQSDPRLIAMRP